MLIDPKNAQLILDRALKEDMTIDVLVKTASDVIERFRAVSTLQRVRNQQQSINDIPDHFRIRAVIGFNDLGFAVQIAPKVQVEESWNQFELHLVTDVFDFVSVLPKH